MEDWEDSAPNLLKKEQLKNNWDDEDLDDVKESWEDDDDEPTPAPKVEPAPEKAPKKAAAKPSEKKGKAVEAPKEAPVGPIEEKLRQQRLVEEADFKSTTELFGKKGSDEKTLDNFIPKTENDFEEYAELIVHKLRPYEKSYHYKALMKAVNRLGMEALIGADVKEVASSVTAIANEKIKAEKEANAGKKKTGGKKKQLHIGKPDDDVIVDYDDVGDDYDFM